MSSGKTAEVVRLLTRRQIAGQSVLLITPARDTRVAPGEVVSRTGTRFPSVVAPDAEAIRKEVARINPDAVAIEELPDVNDTASIAALLDSLPDDEVQG
ncbi:MAG: hypothetical protein EBX99_13040, partial [Acidimicrobiia bacterium]|nr:hypothetical protein [Acidimicrobiia bacterium]